MLFNQAFEIVIFFLFFFFFFFFFFIIVVIEVSATVMFNIISR
ncbi:Uncharacterised protein [Mycobacteroides abscessus subsp. abscessus]|nr:Uncharacterised protein [Mycobacteroides abscessus subsp. abscessus]